MSIIGDSVQFDNICRTCLSMEENMKSIFDTDSSLGETLQLLQMLIACTSVQVAADDGLPGRICLSCINHITRSFSFKNLCEQSDSTLRTVLEKATINHDPNMLDIKVEFKEGETNIDYLPLSDTKYNEYEDSQMMNNAEDLQCQITQSSHTNDTKPDDIKDEPMMDERDFETDTSLIVRKGNSICPMPDGSEQSIYPCEKCTACFTVANDLNMHLRTTHRKRAQHNATSHHYKCKVCGLTFASAIECGKHKQAHRHHRKSNVCNECGKGFKHPYELKKHARTHTGATIFACKLCDKTFALSRGLNGHMRAHATDNKKKFICIECGMTFARRTNLNVHKSTHTGSKACVCNVCGKQLSRAGSLTVHMKSHTGLKDHVCPYCNRGFTTPSSLNIHKRTHTGEKPYICNVCKRGFLTASNLKQHLLIHTGEKPHQCHLCSMMFARPENLQIHIKRHTGERTHICEYCKKSFLLPSGLKDHLRMHTGEKPFTCHVCDKSFSRVATLSKHLKAH